MDAGNAVTWYEILSIILTGMGVLLIPLIIVLIRVTVRWTRTENTLATLVSQVKEHSDSCQQVHAEMFKQMRLDREATNQRLYYLEKIWIEKGLRVR